MAEKSVYTLLNEIQQKLVAPKSQFNKFGNYYYRNAEDIIDAVKPLLGRGVIVISDDLINVGDRYYIKATASLTLDNETVSASGYARESLDKKGMDDSQITGAASSYARKYALNGLFAIDDTKDADTQSDVKKTKGSAPIQKPVANTSAEELEKPWFNDEHYTKLEQSINEGKTYTMDQIKDRFKMSKVNYARVIKLLERQ